MAITIRCQYDGTDKMAMEIFDEALLDRLNARTAKKVSMQT